jgi:hypothetical protein
LENIPWASQESSTFKNKIIENPSMTIASLCLDPIKNSYRDHTRGTGKRAGSFGDRDDVANNIDSSSIVGGVNKKEEKLELDEDRTIFLTGIHACCTKAVLKTAVTDILAAVANIPIGKTTYVIF